MSLPCPESRAAHKMGSGRSWGWPDDAPCGRKNGKNILIFCGLGFDLAQTGELRALRFNRGHVYQRGLAAFAVASLVIALGAGAGVARSGLRDAKPHVGVT